MNIRLINICEYDRKAQKISLLLCSLHSSEMYRRQIVNKCIHQKVLIRTMKKKKDSKNIERHGTECHFNWRCFS